LRIETFYKMKNFKHRCLSEIFAWLELLFCLLPGKLGFVIRRLNYLLFLGKSGSKFNIGLFCRIQQPNAVFIEDNVGINDRAWIAANFCNGEIYIGKNTIIGPNVILHTGNHNFNKKDIPIRKQGHSFEPIHIGEDVWVGANVTILKGVHIGKGAIIAAGSLVNKDVETMTIVAGIPSRKIGMRE
jgi:acetyltransferase-like isoleucine patch superfamily enzyme